MAALTNITREDFTQTTKVHHHGAFTLADTFSWRVLNSVTPVYNRCWPDSQLNSNEYEKALREDTNTARWL